MRAIFSHAGRWYQPLVAAGCSVFVLLAGLVGQAVGERFSLALLYLAAVALAAWYGSRAVGLFVAALASGVWLVNFLQFQALTADPTGLYWNAAQAPILFFLVGLLISRVAGLLREHKELARTDFLTHAPNSRAFYERLEHETACLRRYRLPLSLAYIDVDNFKTINDRFGHAEGDELLKTVSACVMQNIRATDFMARMGGDEFTLLIPNTGPDAAQVLVRRLLSRLSEEMRLNGWPTTFSIGIITCLVPPVSGEDLVKVADRMMYSVKNRGKNAIRHELYNAPSTRRLEDWDQTEERSA